jgi:hypothetical protein
MFLWTVPRGEYLSLSCSQFIERSPNHRLGCRADDIDDIRRHPWFRGIDWEAMETKQLQPPFVPDVRLLLPILESFIDDSVR